MTRHSWLPVVHYDFMKITVWLLSTVVCLFMAFVNKSFRTNYRVARAFGAIVPGRFANQDTILTNDETLGWFPFRPNEDFSPSVIDASSWLDAPAGKHGFVRMKGDHFVFDDGQAVKFWGVNIANGWPFAAQDEATRWARYLAKYGVNSVRFHKFTNPGLTGNVSTRLDSALFNRFDYFSQQLRQRGIYYGWSHIYGHKPRPGDRNRLLAYDEVTKAGGAHLKGSTIGLVNFAPDLQELSIELTVNMLNHRNPYTGLRYADDPALSFVELQNEDNIYFATTLNWVQACPTYKKLFCRQFCEWLQKKYGTQERLLAAWGPKALNAFPDYQTDEELDKQTILPMAHHGYLSRKTLANPALRQRLLDTARFLYEMQTAFYARYVAAIRQTGYKGPIVGSCWQAGDDVAHYYNLHNDYQVGFIDRHNYAGGGEGGHNLKPGKVDTTSMLSRPGSGLLSTGMQAVQNRPFALSEWMSMVPNEWTAESAPLVAVYGMGLQGWDASYAYGSNEAGFDSTVQSTRHGVYNVDSPVQIGLYPALARMVYRGDVKQGGSVALRTVHVQSLATGTIGFSETISQQQDVKQFGGDVSPELLALGRVALAFSEDTTPARTPLAVKTVPAPSILRANTGQLAWHPGNKGFFTVNTPGTKAVIGFATGQAHTLGELTIRPETNFAVIFVTSLEKDRSVTQSKRLLITTVGRARNTGMTYSADGSQLLTVGEAPVLLEPVKASLTLQRAGTPTVYVLDHAGRRTGRRIDAQRGRLQLDGQASQTLYYEIVYP